MTIAAANAPAWRGHGQGWIVLKQLLPVVAGQGWIVFKQLPPVVAGPRELFRNNRSWVRFVSGNNLVAGRRVLDTAIELFQENSLLGNHTRDLSRAQTARRVAAGCGRHRECEVFHRTRVATCGRAGQGVGVRVPARGGGGALVEDALRRGIGTLAAWPNAPYPTRFANSACRSAMATRSCRRVSRSRMVTWLSSSDSKSTVMQRGAPTSSKRR